MTPTSHDQSRNFGTNPALSSAFLNPVTLRIRRMHHQCGKDIQDVSHPFAVAVAHDRGVEAEHLLGGLGKNWTRFTRPGKRLQKAIKKWPLK